MLFELQGMNSVPVCVQDAFPLPASVLQVFFRDLVKVFRYRSEADVGPQGADAGLGAARRLLEVF